MKRYRKKPIVIEAMKWDGRNEKEIFIFMIGDTIGTISDTIKDSDDVVKEDTLIIETLEGKMKASVGDYIIKGIKGEFYPCKPDIFEATYEEVKDE